MKRSKIFSTLAKILVVLEFVSGIVLGNLFPIVDLIEYFNWGLAAVCWIITLLTIPSLYAVYALIRNQEEIIENTSK